MQDESIIISIKSLGRRQRTRDSMLTALMWGIYIYLWIPAITLGAWLIGFERFYEVVALYGGYEMVLEMLDWYAMVILAIATCIVGWSGLNNRRFRNRERRNATAKTSSRQISEFFGNSEKEVRRAQQSRRILIELDDIGCISNMTYYGYIDSHDRPEALEAREA